MATQFGSMNIIIVGAGLAGAMAAKVFSQYNPVVYAMERKHLLDHKAVMRVCDPSVALLLGCRAKEITIHKSVYYSGRLHNYADITMNNVYSLKTSGSINRRSIGDLGEVKRYHIQGEWDISNAYYGYQFLGIDNDMLIFRGSDGDDALVQYVQYDYCISTVPLPYLGRVLGLDKAVQTADLQSKDIIVVHITVNVHCTVNQTVYFPGLEFNTYRASLGDNGYLILECVGGRPTDDEIDLIMKVFGFNGISDAKDMVQFAHASAKIPVHNGVNDIHRKSIIWTITNKHRVFCLGRMGVWRPLRAEDIMSDAHKIYSMIESRNAYDVDKSIGGWIK